jgi:hypothetical protein
VFSTLAKTASTPKKRPTWSDAERVCRYELIPTKSNVISRMEKKIPKNHLLLISAHHTLSVSNKLLLRVALKNKAIP